MEEAVENLEKSVKTTDQKLENVVCKIDEYEKNMSENVNNDVAVFEILESVTEVKNEYQNLRKDILEVQVLQKQLANNLRTQLKQVQGTFTMLKGKIVRPEAATQERVRIEGK
ncbi:uncharacterized protein LOC113371675 [Ctenocephalides felis]|uniref:uncharacterized protein LOC113370337 n=1 Tax=Ctenocephalides felis TaxID=7515 RepID=UPI000E6E1DA9|nr:uncharacterized protein LOC113370337 [Ctenocephalides felis]XP_026467908.1 uncharacterized protein LOC113371499 [Ctenocephalides felis]XP_026468108.1 uncharacterized protein LOC113371675 [Ctenocephalides felis]